MYKHAGGLQVIKLEPVVIDLHSVNVLSLMLTAGDRQHVLDQIHQCMSSLPPSHSPSLPSSLPACQSSFFSLCVSLTRPGLGWIVVMQWLCVEAGLVKSVADSEMLMVLLFVSPFVPSVLAVLDGF